MGLIPERRAGPTEQMCICQYLVRKYFSARPVPVQNDFASWSLTWSRLGLTQAQAPLRFFSACATIKRIVMQTRRPHRFCEGFCVSVT